MTYAPTRSMNNDLSEGMTDGKYKKVSPNRGGFVEHTAMTERADLDDEYFGIHEKQVKVAPDGLLHATPQYIATRPVNRGQF